MIESFYWKKNLLKHAKSLRPVKKPPNWSEKQMVNFEKNIIISFFLIRMLFDNNKISQKSRTYKAKVFRYKPTGKKITKRNHFCIDEIYNLKKEHQVQKGFIFIANQLIHSCTIFAYRNTTNRNWEGIYACSDFERDKTIYRITVDEIIKIFELVGNDYPTEIRMTWNKEKDDYDVKTN